MISNNSKVKACDDQGAKGEGLRRLTIDQFIPSAPGFGAVGKNMKMKAIIRNAIATVLQNIPSLPRLNLPGGKCSPRSRFQKTHITARRYDEMRPVSESDVRMAKAGELGVPMMNKERTIVMPSVNIMALTGTFQPAWTFAKKLAYGMPRSRANDLAIISG